MSTDRPCEPSAARPDCELFCRVVDNFGDIGVCWRLARELAARGLRVRLWVDDWATLARLCPAAGAGRDGVHSAGVELRRWEEVFPRVEPARLVVEAFACELPEIHLSAMAACRPAPAWVNLEYLSAEDWVEGCHGMASPHPRLGLVKHFVFPGFTPATGGLLRECGLLQARRLFQGDAQAPAAWLKGLGLRPAPGALVVSLFAYAHDGLADLLDAWAAGPRPLCLLVPHGRMARALAAAFGAASAAPGDVFARGLLTAHILPFTGQDAYDRLLWACDLNFVRGEDSFVRAQWAARPFVWQIYAQEEGAHHAKLEAFLGRHGENLAEDVAAPLRRFWHAWNGLAAAGGEPESPAACWPAMAAVLPALSVHAQGWAAALESLPDLAGVLAQYPDATVKS
ncbi:elongation factor P maturation arginine rhamnosyltransferase EarP [Pseudothauera nasutitermitis]|uniref:Protein-arginine rhamnosyltransferase n=1 Tax=Pseudothauera nasutitermitis TaxID=2565930 RepID=A0A4S4AYW3_9RHOO|nr:elongation factor P maturation arginine rhamnosyltransferase EarP [Pseudothauera nasutitermitis]THF64531.1 elongation factor P maturation arginine rhamnosyltransferase EarP [Pseudothauera nasutitermitis]